MPLGIIVLVGTILLLGALADVEREHREHTRSGLSLRRIAVRGGAHFRDTRSLVIYDANTLAKNSTFDRCVGPLAGSILSG
jgi:hypothetical protein